MKGAHQKEDGLAEEEGVEGGLGDDPGPAVKGEGAFVTKPDQCADHGEEEGGLDAEVDVGSAAAGKEDQVGEEVDAVANSAGEVEAELVEEEQGEDHHQAVEEIAGGAVIACEGSGGHEWCLPLSLVSNGERLSAQGTVYLVIFEFRSPIEIALRYLGMGPIEICRKNFRSCSVRSIRMEIRDPNKRGSGQDCSRGHRKGQFFLPNRE